jgi:hypothetical protein
MSVSPVIALIAALSMALLVFGIFWLIGPSKPHQTDRDGGRASYRPTAVHRWGDEERTRDLR